MMSTKANPYIDPHQTNGRSNKAKQGHERESDQDGK